ncbi:MAG: hypothetical protein RMK29_05270 [Myxococcales bacterium]|nr:hypothetical protein [Myxococcota bacterium]MDW8281101.1 hypothetical protein [Myxococcales bacterium]
MKTLRPLSLPLRAVAGLVAWVCAGPVHALEPVQGLRSLAMGDSLRAAATGAEGVLLNPSGIALLRQYIVTGFYSFRIQHLGHALHVSVADSVTQRRLAMGLYYTFLRETPQLGLRVAEHEAPGSRVISIRDVQMVRHGHEVGLVSAFPLGDRFILGLTTKYGYFSSTVALPQDQLPGDFSPSNPRIDADRVYDLGSVNNVVSFDVGITVRVLDRLTLGLVGQNLWGHGVEQPTMLGSGLATWLTHRLTIAADVLINFTGYQNCVGPDSDPCQEVHNRTVVRAGGGLEYSVADRLPLRAGYLYDSHTNGHHVSAGLGYFNPRFAFDLGMRQRLSGGLETVLLLGFRLFRD